MCKISFFPLPFGFSKRELPELIYELLTSNRELIHNCIDRNAAKDLFLRSNPPRSPDISLWEYFKNRVHATFAYKFV